MYSLFIDTHDLDLVIALYKDKKLKDKEIKESLRNHSDYTMPIIDEIIERNNIGIHDIKEILVVNGPGSFTGIRIAMSLIKGIFALEKDVEIFSVSELDAIFYPAKDLASIVVSGIDSRKGKIYYNIHENGVKIKDDTIGNIYTLVEELKNTKKSIVFAGDIAYNYKEVIETLDTVKISYHKLLVDSKVFYDMFKDNLAQKEDIASIHPYYLEQSQAEREYKGV